MFGGIAAWRAWHGQVDGWTQALAVAALGVGGIGLAWPAAVRPIYTGWMIAAFPIGWTISKIVLGGMFYLVFTPLALFFADWPRCAAPAPRRLVKPTGAGSPPPNPVQNT